MSDLRPPRTPDAPATDGGPPARGAIPRPGRDEDDARGAPGGAHFRGPRSDSVRRGPGTGAGIGAGGQTGRGNVRPANGPVRPARRASAASSRPLRIGPRRWPRRILVAANVSVAVILLAAGSVYGYVNWRFGQIKRISLPSIFHPAKAEPAGSPFTVLVVGSDSRSVLTGPADQKQFNDPGNPVTGQRSDTIILVHVDPKNTRASILSVPRDLWWDPLESTCRHASLSIL